MSAIPDIQKLSIMINKAGGNNNNKRAGFDKSLLDAKRPPSSAAT